MSYNHQHNYIYLQSHVIKIKWIYLSVERKLLNIQNKGKIQIFLFYIMFVDC